MIICILYRFHTTYTYLHHITREWSSGTRIFETATVPRSPRRARVDQPHLQRQGLWRRWFLHMISDKYIQNHINTYPVCYIW